jgi:hypothetical protein
MLGGVEGRVDRREVALQRGQVSPTGRPAEIRLGVGGEDAVEQLPPLAVERHGVEVDDVDDADDVLAAHAHSSLAPSVFAADPRPPLATNQAWGRAGVNV